MDFKEETQFIETLKEERVVKISQFDNEINDKCFPTDLDLDDLIHALLNVPEPIDTVHFYNIVNDFANYLKINHPTAISNFQIIDILVNIGLSQNHLDIVSTSLLCLYYLVDYVENADKYFFERFYYLKVQEFILDMPTRVTTFSLWIFSALILKIQEMIPIFISIFSEQMLTRLIVPQIDEIGLMNLIASKQRPYIIETILKSFYFLLTKAPSDDIISIAAYIIKLIFSHDCSYSFKLISFRIIYQIFKNKQFSPDLFPSINIEEVIHLLQSEINNSDIIVIICGLIPFVEHNNRIFLAYINNFIQIFELHIDNPSGYFIIKLILVIMNNSSKDNVISLMIESNLLNIIYENLEIFTFNSLKIILLLTHNFICEVTCSMSLCVLNDNMFHLLSKMSEIYDSFFANLILECYEIIYNKFTIERPKIIQLSHDHCVDSWLENFEENVVDDALIERAQSIYNKIFVY